MPKDTNQPATIGFESDLWRAAEALHSHIDGARRWIAG